MFQSVASMWSIEIVYEQLSPLSCNAMCFFISETDCPLSFGPNLLLEYIELAKKSVWVFCNIVCKTWMNFLANQLKQKAIPLVFRML